MELFQILRNSIKCTLCNDEIVSTYRHDFKWCKCKSVAVDGGTSYLKRTGTEFVDTSIGANFIPIKNIDSKNGYEIKEQIEVRKLALKLQPNYISPGKLVDELTKLYEYQIENRKNENIIS